MILQKFVLILIRVLTIIAYQRFVTQSPIEIHAKADTTEKMHKYDLLWEPNIG